MKNTYTATQQKELFAKDCKLINLKYEYTGYIGQEKWAIVSELSEQELFEKYPDEVKKYMEAMPKHISLASYGMQEKRDLYYLLLNGRRIEKR